MGKLYEYLFQTTDERIVIRQRPNAPIILAGIGFLISWVATDRVAEFFWWFGWGGLMSWAVLEVQSGVNRFRRLIGILGIVLALVMALAALEQN